MSRTNLSVRRRLSRAMLPVVCESLESRWLLTSYVYDVPLGVSIAYILPKSVGGTAGQVEIRLGSRTADPVEPNPFDNDTGLDIIRVHSSVEDFVFVDAVPADLKPRKDTSTPNDPFGIQVEGGTDGHLIIETGEDDHLIRVIESTANSGAVETRPSYSSTDIGNSRFASGVNKLTIQTHASGDAEVRVATDEPVFLPPLPPPPLFDDLPGLHPNTALHIESLGPRDQIHLGGGNDASVHATVRTGVGTNRVVLQQDKQADGTTTAFVDFDPTLGGGLGARHRLELGSFTDGSGTNCTATLKRPAGASHAITLDLIFLTNGGALAVNADTPATVNIEDQTRLGEARVFQDGGVTALNQDPLIDVKAPLTVEHSASTTGIVYLGGRMDFAAASKPSTVYQFEVGIKSEQPLELLAWEDALGVLNLNQRDPDPDPPDDLTVQFDSRIPLLNIWAGPRFTFQRRSDAPTQTNARLLALKELFIEKDPMAPEAILDLKDNSMIIDYVGDSPLHDIRQYITEAYDLDASPHWITNNVLHNGINSSIAATRTDVGIGYAEATDLFTTFPATFEGQSVDNTSVLVKYTFYGDADLSGHVSLADFNRLAANFGATGQHVVWSQGDFNYDRFINLSDFNRLAGNFGAGGLAPGEESYSYAELEEMLPD